MAGSVEKDVDLCCAIRKTNPLDAALDGFDAWITGRKRAQGGTRSHSTWWRPGRMVVSPSTRWRFWDDEMIEAYFEAHDLPRHPLQAQGYTSIGCATCTERPRRRGQALGPLGRAR